MFSYASVAFYYFIFILFFIISFFVLVDLGDHVFVQVLREYNHVNPQDDEEGKVFLNSRVSLRLLYIVIYIYIYVYSSCGLMSSLNPNV